MLSFRLQLAIIVLASVSMLGLAGVLIHDVIVRTEGRLVEEARQQTATASQELRRQFEDWAAFSVDDPVEQLPAEARDVSLRGLSATVLRSYEGLQGGFHLPGVTGLTGVSGPQPLAEEDERLVLAAASEARTRQEPVTRVAAWARDVAVVTAAPAATGHAVAWTVKHLPGVRDPVMARRRWLLALLVLCALLGTGGVISVWLSLQSGVTAVRDGLRRLEENFQFRLPAIRGDFGRITEAINHMSERRAALEAELRRQDRLAALGKAVAGVAHEIRNPLNSIKLTLELLDRRLKRGAAAGDEVAAAVQEVDRLDQIVGRLLAFGRPALLDQHRQDVTPLLRQAVGMVEEQGRRQGVTVVLETDSAGEIVADVDGPQIQQVVLNLMLNAIDASPPAGIVRAAARTEGDLVSIAVSDSGPGIPEEARPHIFDVYFTTKAAGVGLGLSVSREIVVNHGGHIEFESSPEGTTFRVLLPVERSRAGETQGVGARSRG